MGLPKKIFIVDDEKDLVEILEYAFLEKKYHVAVAHNGADAFVRTRNTKFDLIISDYRMPKATGADLLFAVRDHQLNAKTPVIFISGFIEEVQAKVKGIPHVHVVGKPFDVDELVALGEKVMAESAASATPAPQNQPPAIDALLVNAFVRSTFETFQTLASLQTVKPQRPFLLSVSNAPKVNVVAQIELDSNKFKGSLHLAFPNATFQHFASRMSGGIQSSINDQTLGMVTEAVKIIFGQVAKALSEKGYQFHKAEPKIESGSDVIPKTSSGKTILVLPFKTEIGEFYVFVSVRVAATSAA